MLVAEIINLSRTLRSLNQVGFAELILTGGNAGSMSMEKLFKIRQELLCLLQR